MIIIADIAGRFEELQLLLQKIPQGDVIVCVGDLNDRGKDSNKVIQWCIDNNIQCTKSNHGDMFIGYFNRHRGTTYPCLDGFNDPDFLNNGGHDTLSSYGGITEVPESHIKWLSELPWYIETDDLYISHAPIVYTAKHPDDVSGYDKPWRSNILWNRHPPVRREKFQIYGHNTYYQVFNYENEDYAICIDNCGFEQLMAIHWPSKKLYTVDYLDKDHDI